MGECSVNIEINNTYTLKMQFGCLASLGLLVNSFYSSCYALVSAEQASEDGQGFEVMDLSDFKKSGKQFQTSDEGDLVQCFLAINKQTNPAFKQYLEIFTTVAKNFSKNFSSFSVNFNYIDSSSRVKYGPLFTEFKIRSDSGVKLIIMKINMRKPSRPKFYDSPFEHEYYVAERENEYLQEMEEFLLN